MDESLRVRALCFGVYVMWDHLYGMCEWLLISGHRRSITVMVLLILATISIWLHDKDR